MFFEDRKSLKDYYWKVRNPDEKSVLTLYQKFGISEILSRLLALREIGIESVNDYLKPTLRRYLPDPYSFLDMAKAVDTVYDALKKDKKICVYGDYDVDGATSSALLKRFFRAIGNNVQVCIPDRIQDGYGLNINAVRKLKKDGAELLITVDCGISAFESIEEANKLGIDVVVIDHHLGSEKLPNAKAVVDPNRLDETTEHKNLAGVGVCYLFCIALNKKLRTEGWYDENVNEPDLVGFLDLVALGTVCDVVPLRGLNRVFVKQGLKVLGRRRNLGIKTLTDVAGVRERISAYHLGFVLGPRINAGGRVGSSDLGSRLLYTEDEFEAAGIAMRLNELNRKRQDIEKEVLQDAIFKIENCGLNNFPFIFVSDENWHEGVIGIVASRLKERYNKPVAVISVTDGIAKSSVRSVHGVDIGSAIIEAKMKDIVLEGGGHCMAGGFTAKANRLEELHKFVCDKLRKDIEFYISNKEKNVDLVLECGSVTVDLAKEIEKLGPYGAGNHKPKIILKNVAIIKSDLIGKDKNHIRCIIAGDNFLNLSTGIPAMLFRIDKEEVLYSALSKAGKKVHLLGEISINRWMGHEKVQFIIEDVMG